MKHLGAALKAAALFALVGPAVALTALELTRGPSVSFNPGPAYLMALLFGAPIGAIVGLPFGLASSFLLGRPDEQTKTEQLRRRIVALAMGLAYSAVPPVLLAFMEAAQYFGNDYASLTGMGVFERNLFKDSTLIFFWLPTLVSALTFALVFARNSSTLLKPEDTLGQNALEPLPRNDPRRKWFLNGLCAGALATVAVGAVQGRPIMLGAVDGVILGAFLGGLVGAALWWLRKGRTA